ncbi:YiiX/YebB-like N1pC/P60 family cysteine hydrolase [Olleya sp. UBA1516]|uniref:YiiX/YebB-like N1pC/P60 family cysteine hydrolase n=1 Tax=Olleya sp. UBA1516 TaxID=1947013 RepID=UPI0025F40005|nr:YiiX/YebB-like N1pC/P60 family cysteine hydrolase [Olleya sp. UBA1516]|tara:strand:+ start:134325 stop:134960 length:636 start_codon:yes stop_codon:yes gene_type:complete
MLKTTIKISLVLAVIFLAYKFFKDDSNRPYESSFLYKLSPKEKAKLQTGDIILRRGYGFVSTMISKMMSEDYDVTHLGVVIKQNDNLKIAHALSSSVSNQDGLRLQAIDSFVHNSHDKTILVTRLKNIDTIKQSKIVKQIDYYYKKQLPFDHSFNYKDTTEHYCSELIWRIYEHNLKILQVADSITDQQKYNSLKTFYDPNYFNIIINHQK